MTDINHDLIKQRIKELGLSYTKIEKQFGMGKNRMANVMQIPSRVKFREMEVKRLSKLLDIDKKEFGDNILKGEAKSGRPKPFKTPPTMEIDRVIVKKFMARKIKLQHLRRERGVMFSKLCRDNGLDKDYITDILSHQFPVFTIEMFDLMAKALQCRISEIADIPASLDADYTEEVVVQVTRPNNPIHWISRFDPKDDPRYLENPVDHVIPIPQGTDSDTKVPLADEPSPHIEHRINGVVAWRYQDGNAILFANEHIKHEHILVAMEQIKQWGEKVAQRGKS